LAITAERTLELVFHSNAINLNLHHLRPKRDTVIAFAHWCGILKLEARQSTSKGCIQLHSMDCSFMKFVRRLMTFRCAPLELDNISAKLCGCLISSPKLSCDVFDGPIASICPQGNDIGLRGIGTGVFQFSLFFVQFPFYFLQIPLSRDNESF
jgi:hypothetical protein